MRNIFGGISTLASCLFLVAFSFAAFAQPPHVAEATAASGPDLSISVTHTSSFLRGQTNAVYLIRVLNHGTMPTSGTISVIDTLPSGITLTSMSGPGWSCLSNTCNRNDSAPAGQMLPTITVLAKIETNAPASISNMVTVSGGGDSTITDNLATDVAAVNNEGWLLGLPPSTYSSTAYAPYGLSDVVAVASSASYGIALRKDGTVYDWANYYSGPSSTASALTGVVAVAVGDGNYFALKADGTVVGWQQYTTSLDTSQLTSIVAIRASTYTAMAVKADGTVKTFGTGYLGETTVPPSLANVIQVSYRYGVAAALTADGSVVAWGNAAPATPASLGPLVRIAAIGAGTLAGIRSDGSVTVWNQSGTGALLNLPSGLSNVVDVLGDDYGVALRADGTAVGWGGTNSSLPAMAAGLAAATALTASSNGMFAILTAAPVTLTVQAVAPPVDLTSSSYYYTRPTFSIDGASYSSTISMQVAPGSTHTLSTTATQGDITTPAQFLFLDWSDNGALSHTVNVGTTGANISASFKPRFRLTTSAGTGGSISPPTALYDVGATVLVRATPDNGYVVAGLVDTSGGYSTDANNPIRVVMNSPRTISATFTSPQGAYLRPTLKPMRQLLQGQQNAVYIARVENAGTASATGAMVQFTGLTGYSSTASLMRGTGWTCSTSSCTRSDTLAPGQAYPAIVIVTPVVSSATGTLIPSISVTQYPYSSLTLYAYAASTVNGSGNSAVAWGDNSAGQAAPPSGLTNLVAVAAGAKHSVALRGDATVTAWGDNSKQQTAVPAGLVSAIAIAAGSNHSLALTANGAVVAWGDNSAGQTTVPASATNVIAIAAGAGHSLALTSSGSVVAWGANGSGQSTVPASVQDAVAIAAGGNHSLAVLRNGTVVAWGSNSAGESTVPASLTRVEFAAAGPQFSLAVQDDGTVVAWGSIPPSIVANLPAGLTDIRDLAAGGAHALGLKWDGTLVQWGDNVAGLPQNLTNVMSVAAGAAHSVVIASTPALVAVSINPTPNDASYQVDGVTYSNSQLFLWVYGSQHTASAISPNFPAAAGTRYVFYNWSDYGSTPTVNIAALYNRSYTVTYTTQYLLTTSASAGGTITPATGYVATGTAVTVTATALQGYTFTGFGGDLAGLQTPRTVQINQPLTITASFSAAQGPAQLTINLRHSGPLLRDQTNAFYLLRVANGALGGPTNGKVTVTPAAPAGLTITSMSGSGWTCTTSTCTRSDALAAGSSYPAILINAAVDPYAPPSLTLQAAASGGGSASTATTSQTTEVQSVSYAVVWGNLYSYNTPLLQMPANLSDVVAMSIGSRSILAVRKDGTVACWGSNDYGDCAAPEGLNHVVAVATGDAVDFALRSDGTVVAWGNNSTSLAVPTDLTNVVAIRANGSLVAALFSDGTIQYWGSGGNVDAAAVASIRNVVDFALGYNIVALISDGSARVLTTDTNAILPGDAPPFISVAASGSRYGGLTTDGTPYFWGYDPGTPPADWTHLTAMALPGNCGVALKADHTISTWGCSLNTGGGSAWVSSGVLGIQSSSSLTGVLTTAPPDVSAQIYVYSGRMTVDGTEYTQPQSFTWPYASSHLISAVSPIDGTTGVRSVFSQWSDGGAVSHAITATRPDGQSVSVSFKTQYYLTTQATQGGTISPPSGWYDSGYVNLTATPEEGYSFKDFTNANSTSGNQGSVYLYAPTTVTANFISQSTTPKLAITSSHTGNFVQGQSGVKYTLTISNAAGSNPTSGTVYVTNTLPAGLTSVSMSGNGWGCSNSTCSRSDALPGGATYPLITVTANVSPSASSPQVNVATVTGGGSAQAGASDSTTILTLINIASSPAGLTVIVDGTSYTSPTALGWAPGSTHTLNVVSPQATSFSRYLFQNWSDSGAQSHTVTAGSSATTYTAVFKTQYKLALAVLPSGGGTLGASPAAADGWYDAGQAVQVSATPANLFSFIGFSGDLNGTTNPQTLNMTAPRTIYANFVAIDPTPTAVSVTPSSGAGAAANFTATYSAGLGYQDLAWVQLLVAAAPDGGGQPFCFLHYDVKGNRFWVYGEGGFFVGPVQPGTASAGLQNSLCALNTKTSTVTGSGNTLTFKANTVFKAAAANLKVYLRAQTAEGLDTGWVQRGTWTTAATALPTNTVAPASGSGSQQTFTLNYPDPTGFEDATKGWSQFLIAAAPDGGGQPFCFLHYDKAGNGLWMYSSDVGYFVGPIIPGTASNALDSSACSINTALTTVTHQSGVVTINVPVALKAPMAGTKNTYQRTLDALGRDSGWVQTGTWTIP